MTAPTEVPTTTATIAAPVATTVAAPTTTILVSGTACDGRSGNRVAIPAIGVCEHMQNIPVVDGELTPPEEGTGLMDGPNYPGQPGVSVVAGHVDYNGVSGVFADLMKVPKGAEIYVWYNGGAFRFKVFDAAPRPKSAELADLANGVTVPRLFVMTCGGDWNPKTGHYYDNYILQADLA